MCKLHPEDENARRQVEQFCKHVDYLRVVHDIGMELFHDKQAQSLMERTAHVFFFDVSRMVIDHFLLGVAKLTDPPSSPARGGKVENFTVDNMLESIQWPCEGLKELEELRGSALSFRAYITPARNKILAHNDKKTFLSGETLGAFPEGEDRKAMNVLVRMCDILHKASFNGEVYCPMGLPTKEMCAT